MDAKREGPRPIRNIDPELWKRLRMQALDEGHTVGECINEAVAGWLKGRESKRMPEYYRISSERVDEIAKAASMDPAEVRRICTADWHEGMEHQEFLDKESVETIAGWVKYVWSEEQDVMAKEQG